MVPQLVAYERDKDLAVFIKSLMVELSIVNLASKCENPELSGSVKGHASEGCKWTVR